MVKTKSGRSFAVKGRRRGGMRKNAPRRRKAQISKEVFQQRGIPDKLIVKLPYADLQGINGSSAPNQWYAQKSYNVNSIWDPETGSLNQQALFLAQYKNLYKSYRVFKVDYDVILTNTQSQSCIAGSATFAKQSFGPSALDPQTLMMPYSRKVSLANATNGGTRASQRLKGSMFLPRVVGLTSEQFRTNPLYVGDTTSIVNGNPGEIIQLVLTFLNINQSVSCNVQADVRLTYHVELFNRIQITGTTAPEEPSS